MRLERFYDIIKSPVITEKSTIVAESNQYIFKVDLKARKHEIKLAIEQIFKVQVERVNTLIIKGKRKRFRGNMGRRSDYKKAVIKLAAGQTITELGV